ncbi:MAG: hypothetical protein JWM10_5413, partial [Myxococcaceae bacterium]|nr:hypothetical protein [Myxococcaceae bacterium]
MRARRLIGMVVVGSCFGACAPDAAPTPDADVAEDAGPLGRDAPVDAAPDAID